MKGTESWRKSAGGELWPDHAPRPVGLDVAAGQGGRDDGDSCALAFGVPRHVPKARPPVGSRPGYAPAARRGRRRIPRRSLLSPGPARVAAFKAPKTPEIWDELPKTGTGQVLRTRSRLRLKQEAGEG